MASNRWPAAPPMISPTSNGLQRYLCCANLSRGELRKNWNAILLLWINSSKGRLRKARLRVRRIFWKEWISRCAAGEKRRNLLPGTLRRLYFWLKRMPLFELLPWTWVQSLAMAALSTNSDVLRWMIQQTHRPADLLCKL